MVHTSKESLVLEIHILEESIIIVGATFASN